MSRLCANCGANAERAGGISQLYRPNRDEDILLCEPCWHDEDDLVEERGTNVLPDVLASYEANIKAGWR